MISAVLQVFGCCRRYRGTLVVRLDAGLVTVEAFGPSRAAAHAATLVLADTLGIPGYARAAVKER